MKTAFWILIVIIILAIGIWLIYGFSPASTGPASSTNAPTSTQTGGSSGGVMMPAFDQSLSDGTITVHYPSADFALATTQMQILAHSYIPPCSSNFNYCLYYIGTKFQGTNFESAGLRIQKRADLATRTKC